MGKNRPNATERRLSHVRALKEQFFPEDLSLEEQLALKDQQIAELQHEVELLRLRLVRRAPSPESNGPEVPEEIAGITGPEEPRFNFYRD